MTEHEKIFAGKMFNARGAELKAVKHKAHNLCVEYNMLTEDNPRRAEIIHEMLGAHGENVSFQGPVQFNYGMHTKVGSNFFANYNFIVQDDGGVTIGDGAVIGAGSVVTHDIPAGVLAYGVPCRVIREITKEDEKAMEALI